MAGVSGQGRKFDVDAALDRAMHVFWQHGYEGSSVAILTGAMGITAPSMYAAFGSKEQLFDAAVERYNSGVGRWMADAFDEEESVHRLIERLLRDAAVHYTDASAPRGCLVISAASCVREANSAVAERLRLSRNANIDLLAHRLEVARDRGDLSPTADPRMIADLVGATIQGMSQRARDGATVTQLAAVAEGVGRAVEIF
jgi:AcrR family transcriptional regulator